MQKHRGTSARAFWRERVCEGESQKRKCTRRATPGCVHSAVGRGQTSRVGPAGQSSLSGPLLCCSSEDTAPGQSASISLRCMAGGLKLADSLKQSVTDLFGNSPPCTFSSFCALPSRARACLELYSRCFENSGGNTKPYKWQFLFYSLSQGTTKEMLEVPRALFVGHTVEALNSR